MVFLLLAITLKKQRSNSNYLSYAKWLNDEFICCLAIFGIQHLAISLCIELKMQIDTFATSRGISTTSSYLIARNTGGSERNTDKSECK